MAPQVNAPLLNEPTENLAQKKHDNPCTALYNRDSDTTNQYFLPLLSIVKIVRDIEGRGYSVCFVQVLKPKSTFAGRYVRSYHKLGNASDMKNSLYLTVLYVTFRRKCLEPNGQPA